MWYGFVSRPCCLLASRILLRVLRFRLNTITNISEILIQAWKATLADEAFSLNIALYFYLRSVHFIFYNSQYLCQIVYVLFVILVLRQSRSRNSAFYGDSASFIYNEPNWNTLLWKYRRILSVKCYTLYLKMIYLCISRRFIYLSYFILLQELREVNCSEWKHIPHDSSLLLGLTQIPAFIMQAGYRGIKYKILSGLSVKMNK